MARRQPKKTETSPTSSVDSFDEMMAFRCAKNPINGAIPVPGDTVTLNGSDLITNGRSDRDGLKEKLKEMLETMTYDKLVELQAIRAENVNKQLKFVPVPNGYAIKMV